MLWNGTVLITGWIIWFDIYFVIINLHYFIQCYQKKHNKGHVFWLRHTEKHQVLQSNENIHILYTAHSLQRMVVYLWKKRKTCLRNKQTATKFKGLENTGQSKKMFPLSCPWCSHLISICILSITELLYLIITT